MMGAKLILAALLATSQAAIRRKNKGAHYDYLGRLKSDEDPKVTTEDSATVQSQEAKVTVGSGVGAVQSEASQATTGSGEVGMIRHKSGPHYDYLGRLKTEETKSSTGSETAAPNTLKATPTEEPKVTPGSEATQHHKEGPRYDYLGRLKTHGEQPIDSGSGSVQAAVSVTAEAGTVHSAQQNQPAQPAGVGMIKERSNKMAPKAAEDSEVTEGFSGAEDLPSTNNPQQVSVEMKSSPTIGKAVVSGPLFQSDGSNSEHPNIIDKVSDVRQYASEDQSGGVISFPMFLFLACGLGVILWVLKGNQAKDKASSAVQMGGELIQEATAVMDSACGHVKHASFHTRSLTGPSWYNHKTGNDDDDLMPDDECYDDDDSEVPTLVEHKPDPPVDLLDDGVGPKPPVFDLITNDFTVQPAEPMPSKAQSSDTCGFEL